VIDGLAMTRICENDVRNFAEKAMYATIIVIVCFGPAALALSGGAVEPGAPVLVLAAPWRDPAALVEAAGGRVIALAEAPLATLGVFPDAAALERVGARAWAVDGRRVAAFCGVAG
jgi:hypothetical protein